jgi:hypothetical protein
VAARALRQPRRAYGRGDRALHRRRVERHTQPTPVGGGLSRSRREGPVPRPRAGRVRPLPRERVRERHADPGRDVASV